MDSPLCPDCTTKAHKVIDHLLYKLQTHTKKKAVDTRDLDRISHMVDALLDMKNLFGLPDKPDVPPVPDFSHLPKIEILPKRRKTYKKKGQNNPNKEGE